ncbi:MAG: hypothetical protein K0S96_586, partial [Geminicoccaceae bacterium]|nr:hypothetical protein [Geminicoccaceae bacterium]
MPAILFSLLILLGGAGPALAVEPEAWQFLFQRAATPVAERMVAFNDFISAIIVLITAFVL